MDDKKRTRKKKKQEKEFIKNSSKKIALEEKVTPCRLSFGGGSCRRVAPSLFTPTSTKG